VKKKLDSQKDTKTQKEKINHTLKNTKTKKEKINHTLKNTKTKKEKINHPSMKQNISWKSRIFFFFLILILTSPFLLIAITLIMSEK
jgi:ABC-type Na+ efflux pump permease subunit